MIKVLFFAQVRELVGVDFLELPDDYPTVAHLRHALIRKGDRWALALEEGKLLAAVNQSFVHAEHSLNDGDEVAFFPPVTGG
ncbi:molybdopterin synthase sulfur carrier subunit [Xenorhabdus nematophila]|uniref:Molybdopterin synthase sulfur carrier subunit n=1 Tax=Xenorhabdus nematophila (strain ATCC 19061 / DSM 3370 / CCUG 14189 / LMG 1036 / NCIMB 9965 / AN6) TaxID=406817 RepID=D3VAS7_XENNA|nr:molybdopterin synthase sulfur carrier subunit [Xenorhabdus nematophila]CEE92266.1 molybdenum cofactor biosynthesis protein D [Xenorhabdus nematophila str. Anatoliense]CEF33440.1 molybdenum cofactor biosynthesis protein D [Xenorhabdus nematophila str. Websteri]AYA39724.1 molybdopterin synthase sulfur carrier subunit [Xenorhabdus nematophila]KHD27842.1 molybdopterin synthase [Xenorhabdus nematophila]MBA0018295.1 molybdopterin synthase sulfur carrier subunit [Xenorhabdus nematophila]